MNIRMDFNKILIQDVVNKREYNKDVYKTTEISEDDDSYTSDEFNNNADMYSNKITNPIKVDQNSFKNILQNVTPFGDESKFMYADSPIFDRVDQTYGSNNRVVRMDKLISAVDLLRMTIEQNTKVSDNAGNQNRGNRFHGQRNHHHRKNNPSYSDEPQSKKNVESNGDDRMLKRIDKVIVETRVVFLKVGEIDTLKEIYHADAFIQAKWREPKLDNKTQEELKAVDLDKCWNPLLFIDNILNESKDQYWLSSIQNDRKETFIIERRKLKGVFLETLELNDFPLDVQDLTITISSERPDSEIDMVPDNVELSGINVQTFVDQQEWRLHEHVEVIKRVLTHEYTSSSQSHPCLSVTCRASRRPGYFYWNVFLVMFFITGLSFATFAVPPTRPENRLHLSFTLFLTSVAFKFVINQSLPRISYLTYMDKYVLMSLAILCIFSIWHSMVTLIDPPSLNLTRTNLTKYNSIQHLIRHQRLNSSMEILNPITNTLFKRIIRKTKNYSHIKRSIKTSLNDTENINNNSLKDLILYLKEIIEITRPSDIPRLIPEQKSLKEDSKRKLYIVEMSRRYKFQKKVERDIFISFVFLYIFAHLIFIFWLYFDASRRRREMKEKDRIYKKKLKK